MTHPITCRTVEIRDEGTCIAALVIYAVPQHLDTGAPTWLVDRAGWGPDGGVILINLHDGRGCSDPFDRPRNPRTWFVAHNFLRERFHEDGNMWPDGDVLDVQFILGETKSPKRSDRFHE